MVRHPGDHGRGLRLVCAHLLPDTGWVAAVLLGVAAGVSLTASLLLHELAHAHVARGAGIQIEHVRIFAGGALSRRRQDVGTANEQFMVAAAGPLSSFAIGSCSLLLPLILDRAGVSGAPALALGFVAFPTCSSPRPTCCRYSRLTGRS